MNERTKTGITLCVLVLLFLIPAAYFSELLLAACIILTILTSLEMYYALRRRLRPVSLFSLMLGAFSGLAPLIAWINFSDYANWFNLPFRSSGLSAELVQNNLWRSYYFWMLTAGFAAYGFIFLVYAFLSTFWQFKTYDDKILPQATITVFGALYLSAPLAAVTLLCFAVPNGYKWLWFGIVVVTVTDVSAYYGGKNYGKTKIIPNLSPNKTVEGSLCAVLASFVTGALFGLIFLTGSTPQLTGYFANLLFGALAGVFLSIVGQIGDWFASAIKRWAKLKDFSKILPGHGGILDRLDSYMFVLPTLLLVSLIYYLVKF